MGYKVEKSNISESETEKKEIIKEEIKLQFHWYLISFFIIYLGSLTIPGIILYTYIRFFFFPYFLNNKNFLSIFTELYPLTALILLPFVIIGSYLIHIFLIGFLSRWLWSITERISPSKEGIIPRNINSKMLNFYNIRSFMIKYPKNAVIKGPFPWLINWFYNFVGTNTIGKGSTIEEQFGADRFIEVGKNSYIGVNSGFSSHSVEGIFGNISYFKIKIGDNVTTAALNCIAPGVEINNDSYLFPLAGATKHNKLKGDNYYFGIPLRKIFNKKIMDYLDLKEEDFNRDLKLREKKKSL
jgi:acetyltransferase-like isoleucine patch superfamily enzyme